MTTIYLGRAEGTAVGRDVSVSTGGAITRAEGRAIGFPMLVVGATPVVGTVPDALRLEVVDKNGVQLCNDLTARQNFTFTVEHNGSGSCSFNTELASLPSGVEFDPDNPSNLVRVHYGDMPARPYGVAELMPTSAEPTKNDDGSWSLPSVAGVGSWDVLNFGVLWPPAGATGDTREFSYTAGMTSPGYVASEWHTPVGKNVKTSFRWKSRYPRGWPESKAQWLWSSSPEKYAPLGTRLFMGDPFTLTAAKDVHFYAAGDETLKLYLNGARIKTKRRGAWHRTASFIRRLPAGTYTVAAEVANLPGADNKSGFVFAAAQLKANGDREKWLLRSSTSTFKVKVGSGFLGQVPLPPDGWYAPAVLYTHVGEAAARGVDFHPAIVRTFTPTADSSGSAWTVKGPVEYDINTLGGDLGDKIRGLGYDVAMLPGLRLSSWKHRGFDLRDRVIISTPMGTDWSSRAWSRVRTVGLTHQESGWTETAGDPALTAVYGRRELPISGGGIDGDAQADVFATAAMTAAAAPEETIEVTYSSAALDQPMPFRDYDVADIVSVETIGGYTPVKVMSITGAEQDDKSVNWTIAGYPV